MLTNPELRLRPGADRRLRQGHAWIYSNEVDTGQSPLSDFSPGDPVNVTAASGQVLGSAFVEPNALICARLLAREPDLQPDRAFYAARIRSALALRQRWFDSNHYRLLYGDSDGVSGVVVDRFGDYLVLQPNTAGAERHCTALVEALAEILSPAGILLRRDSRSRQEQGLEQSSEVVLGEVPETVELLENDTRFLAPVHAGQKTGWFYDHRLNRRRLREVCAGMRVLDVYSYIGGWGIQAATAGAAEVHCIDNSTAALEWLAGNAALNGVESRVQLHEGRADQVMRELAEAGERFDAVVLDPPAFIQRKRDLGKGRKAYQRINELGLKVLKPGGLLVSASCSMHLPEADLVAAVAAAARRTDRELRVTWVGGQGPDHPVHPVIPETRYLKAVFADAGPEVSPAD